MAGKLGRGALSQDSLLGLTAAGLPVSTLGGGRRAWPGVRASSNRPQGGWLGEYGASLPSPLASALTGRWPARLPSQQVFNRPGKVDNFKAEEIVCEQSTLLICHTLLLANISDCCRPLNSSAPICIRLFSLIDLSVHSICLCRKPRCPPWMYRTGGGTQPRCGVTPRAGRAEEALLLSSRAEESPPPSSPV